MELPKLFDKKISLSQDDPVVQWMTFIRTQISILQCLKYPLLIDEYFTNFNFISLNPVTVGRGDPV